MKRQTLPGAAGATRTESRQGETFAAEPWPEGFVYREELISPDEERALAERFALLPLTPFAFHGFLGRRRIVSFGWRYDYGGRTLRPSEEIPGLLMPLRARAAEFAGVPAQSLQQVLVTEYPPGAAIGWHRDKPMFEDVVAISFLAPCTLRLRHRQEEGWERRSIELRPRSAYLLRGPSRREWEHSIRPPGELRFSVTFRNFTAPIAEAGSLTARKAPAG
jgi:alkylated DNA repair dioxygenase AlkB